MGIIDRIRRRFKQRKAVSLQARYPEYAIGRHSYGHLKVAEWGEGAQLQIGAFCSFAGGVRIFLGGEHRVDWVTTFPFSDLWPAARETTGHPHTRGDVIIGNDVWVGTEALIMSGVRIGDGAVIGARAVVTRDVPPYAVVAGNPARTVRFRFEPRIIEQLMQIQWWDFEDSQIEQLLPLMLSSDIEHFMLKATHFRNHC